MTLYINTTDGDKIIVGLGKDKLSAQEAANCFNLLAPRQQSEKLLPFIDKVLAKKGLALEDLKEIIVADCGGGFSALRIGIATANALAYSLKIPIFSVSGAKPKSKHGLKIIEPRYSREPNIG